ncbi:transmembrane 4 L6 family member 1-like [Glossophaga mutica]
MCSETGSRYTGMMLLPLATTAIIANLLLYFPNGQVLEPTKITDLVWFFHGFLGAGLLVMVPALMLLRGGGEGCCTHRCGMLFPVLLTIQGTLGAVYCVVISSLGLLSGPFCDTGSGNYTYPFRNDSLEDNYLFNQPTWATCQEPEHIVLWNVVLFSILLGIGMIEAVLCLSQVVSGLCDIYCGTCIRKGQNVKHHQVEEVLQGQALSRSGRGGSPENMVTVRPLRPQDDYSPGSGSLVAFPCPCLSWRSGST